MRIVLIGTVVSSYMMLDKVISCGGEVVGVVTKEVSNFNADFVDMQPLCKKHDIPFIT